nr:prepilin peptidase [Gammaproteobacteria bacterium]
MDLIFTHPALAYTLIIIIGLIIGSFINVIIWRYPQMLKRAWHAECLEFLGKIATTPDTKINLCWPRSHCRHCKKNIKIWDNIPILSYLWLKGRCRHCQQRISLSYPLVELMTVAITLVIVMQFGVDWLTLAALIFSWTLITLTVIDINTQLLPDGLTLGLLWLGLLASTMNLITTPQDAIFGAIIGYT